MLTKFTTILSAAALVVASVQALPVPKGEWPASAGLVTTPKPITVAADEVFDGKMQTYERSDITCDGQKEGGAKDAVFLVMPGGTLKNVIIGKNQMEGVHCDKHDCTIENVWWTDVCEDALSIKGGTAESISRVIGGGARYADDKVVQQNGPGKVTIDGFYVEDFGKLYRSCGTCGEVKREVEITNVLAKNPKVSLATVNSNFGDKATLKNIYIESTKKKVKVCAKTFGGKGKEPTEEGDGADGVVCIFDESDIHINAGTPGGSAGNSSEPTEAPEPATQAPVPSTETPEPAAGGDDEYNDDATPAPSDDEGDDNAAPAPSADEGGDDATPAPSADEVDDDATPASSADEGDDDTTSAPSAGGDDDETTPAPASDDAYDDAAAPAPAAGDGSSKDDDASTAPATKTPAAGNDEDDKAAKKAARKAEKERRKAEKAAWKAAKEKKNQGNGDDKAGSV